MQAGIRSTEQKGLSREQSNWRWKILISTYSAYAGFYLTRKVFTICKKPIALDFDIPLSRMAHIWTTFLVAYMVGQFINSFIGRKYGPRVLLLGGLGLSILCNLVFGFSNSYNTFLTFMLYNGLLQAAGWPGSVGAISHWLRPFERGTIMGLWSTNYLVGNMLVKGVGGYLLALTFAIGSGSHSIAVHGWRLSFFGCTLLAFGIWWLIYFWQRDRPEDAGIEPIVPEDTGQIQTVEGSRADHLTVSQYLKLVTHPVVLTMGTSYFCIKFLRYALDSWLPAFLTIQGLSPEHASYYSSIFDFAGLGGAILAGFALDRIFKGNWALVCFLMGIGSIAGYLMVLRFGSDPRAIAYCFGLVGFMVYGPDTLLSGAASIQVAGETNGVAIAGIVNGIASLGPVLQEEVIGWLVKDDEVAGIHNTNLLALSMSILFVLLMVVVMWRLTLAHKKNERDANATAAMP